MGQGVRAARGESRFVTAAAEREGRRPELSVPPRPRRARLLLPFRPLRYRRSGSARLQLTGLESRLRAPDPPLLATPRPGPAGDSDLPWETPAASAARRPACRPGAPAASGGECGPGRGPSGRGEARGRRPGRGLGYTVGLGRTRAGPGG